MNVLLMVAALNWSSFTTEPFDLQKLYIEDCVDPEIQYVASFTGIQGGKTFSEADGAFAALYGPNPIMLPEAVRGRAPMEVWLISRSYALAEVLYDTFRMRTPEELWLSEREMRQWGLSRGDRFTHWLMPRSDCEDSYPIKLRVRTQSDPNSLRASNRLGLAVCDELAWWKDLAWLNLQGRGLVVRTKFLIATSPHGRNFAYRTIAVPGGYAPGRKGRQPGGDPKISIHTWTSADNPHADPSHIDRMRKVFGREYAKQELDGLFTDAIGFVYPQFDRDLMMMAPPSDDPGDYVKIVGGIDPGWTDPYAAGIWAKHTDGRWYQVFEFHQTQRTADDVAPHLLTAQMRWGVKVWYTDKRRPTDIDRLRRNGVHAVPNIDIYRETDRATIPPMLAVCQGLMQEGRIRIGTDNEWTADEFEKYHYPDPNEENPKNTNDIPVDWMNHHMDAMRYALCAAEDIPQGGPRYRQGPSQRPAEILQPKREAFRIPTVAESLAIQDEKMDEVVERNQGASRRSTPAWLKSRLRTRGRV